MLEPQSIIPHLKGTLTLLETQIHYAENKRTLCDYELHNLDEVRKGALYLGVIISKIQRLIHEEFDQIQINRELKLFYNYLSLIRPSLTEIIESPEEEPVRRRLDTQEQLRLGICAH